MGESFERGRWSISGEDAKTRRLAWQHQADKLTYALGAAPRRVLVQPSVQGGDGRAQSAQNRDYHAMH